MVRPLKILTYLLVLLIVLSGAFYGVVRFKPEWNPVPGLLGGPKVVAMKPVEPSEYQALRDSIDALDMAIRTESDANALLGLKDRQTYFRKKVESMRIALSVPPSQPATASLAEPLSREKDEEEFGGLVRTLTKVLAATAGVLVLAIVILLVMLRRRRNEVTRKLEALKTEDRFKSPRGGFQQSADPTLVRPRRRSEGADPTMMSAPSAGTGLPNVQPRRAESAMPPMSTPSVTAPRSILGADEEFDQTVLATQTPNLRPTARQRVTNAIRGLAEALAALKTPTATAESSRSRARVTSQNSTRYTQSMDTTRMGGLPDPHPLEATRFDREREEKGDIVKLARRGYTSSEIARRLRIPQDQVETVIRLQREAGE